MKRLTLARSASIAALSLAAAAGLAACKKDAPVAAQGIPSPVAPVADQPQLLADAGPLPGAPPVRVARARAPADRYAYLDQAYYMRDVLGDAPPDYAFDYDGTEPWVWRSATRDELLYEPYDGGWREYYYRPGDDYPYLVRDPTYAYAYDDGVLAAIYGASGDLLPYDQWAAYAPAAGRYFTRGEALYRAAQAAPRQPVAPQVWQARAPQVRASEAAFAAAQNRDATWRAYHDAHVQEAQAYWRPEVARRRSGAPLQFAQTQPSPVYNPPAFQAGPPPSDRIGQINQARQAQENARVANAAARNQQVQADRFAAEQGRAAAMQARHQAEEAQRAAAAQSRLAETNARVQQDEARRVEAGRHEAERAQRQAEQAQRAQAEQVQRAQAEAGRRQAEQAQRAQAEAGRRQAEQAQRAQAEQAQRAQAEAGRRQAEQAQRAQAEQAQRQAEQAQRAQAQAQHAQEEAARQQQKAQAQAQRAQAEQARQAPPANAGGPGADHGADHGNDHGGGGHGHGHDKG